MTVQQTGDVPALVRFVAERRAAQGRAITTLPDTLLVAGALDRLAGGDRAALPTVLDGLRRAVWRWRWLKNYLKAYTVMERDSTPMGIDHYLVAWPTEYANAAALESVLRQTFQLPAVEQAPLPSLFAGQYHEDATALRPVQAADPWLRVVTAYDIRRPWDLAGWQELLMGQQELALCIDVQTLLRGAPDGRSWCASRTEYAVMTRYEALKAEIAFNTREWRNYGAANWIADQTIKTLIGEGTSSDYGAITLTTSVIKLLGRQEGMDAEPLREFYPMLTPGQVSAIRAAEPGSLSGSLAATCITCECG